MYDIVQTLVNLYIMTMFRNSIILCENVRTFDDQYMTMLRGFLVYDNDQVETLGH